MFEPLVVTLLPTLFLAVLFGGGEALRRQQINQDGEAPIDRGMFYASKYAIVVLWGAVIANSWGAPVSLFDVPPASRRMGLLLWAAGFLLLFVGRFGLGKSFRIGSPTEPTNLRVNGLFRLSRNPMYVGVYATLVASVFYTLNPIVLAVVIFVIVVHHRIVLAEERYLANAFGSTYAGYCRRVRRYV
jgi:protein-S-isoprenylcysteine O-methyltransferase Ste14